MKKPHPAECVCATCASEKDFDFPEHLLDKITSGDVVVFAGAGISTENRAHCKSPLKECPKCILILTPNFLTNNGWSKREYDSIFTRELVERQQVILPVWSDVDAAGVYEYSPILADRVAVNWSLGVEEVARRLVRALDT
ncbi:hypothetical protein [Bradyrhizobium sp. CCBAU 11430]|uniref:hypothetical protein n=1 Tax=Bradyrhizobium sp. CCBAU 11430 TaxID=1630881 RepID=UPI002306B736|nr:hypothetical protein [Bradyrhizobium sp. CCBAU 11430]